MIPLTRGSILGVERCPGGRVLLRYAVRDDHSGSFVQLCAEVTPEVAAEVLAAWEKSETPRVEIQITPAS